MIRHATKEDLPEISVLHVTGFQGHFLTKLGPKLLEKYYLEFMKEEDIFLVTINEHGKIDGFVVGTPDSSAGRKRFIRNNYLRLTGKIIRLMITFDRKTMEKVSSYIRRPIRGNRGTKQANRNVSQIRLLSICVSDKTKGKGIAKNLVSEFEKELLQRGFLSYGLTVKRTNTRAIGFYNKIGMKICDEKGPEILLNKELSSSL